MTKEALLEKAKALPLLPGVYFMKDDLGSIIYVGKSKVLKQRVSSYFLGGKKPQKVECMVRQIHDFEIHYTDTELEALLLECRMIKQIQPLYNRLLKKDHKYRYLYLNPRDARVRVKLVRDQESKEGYYFGPYEKGEVLFQAVQLLNHIFELADCKYSEIKENCLTYKRGRCIGMCKAPYDEKKFQEQIYKLLLFLEEQDSTLIQDYEEKMKAAAETLDFEKAQQFKEEWEALKYLQFKKEALQFAKTHQVIFFKLPMPAGGTKLFMLQSYQILCSEVIPKELKSQSALITKCLKLYEKADGKKEVCFDKAVMDEIYILHGYLKKLAADEIKFFTLIPEEKQEVKEVKHILKDWLQKE